MRANAAMGRRRACGAVWLKVLTPRGEGGISVLLVSGPGAARALDRLFVSPRGRRPSDARPGDLLYGVLRHRGQPLDEAVVCRRRSPEDVFEVNCHGGAMPLRKVLEALKALGAEEAPASALGAAQWMPLGRCDATRAEAAEALPRVASDIAVRMLLDQVNGALGEALGRAVCALDGLETTALLRTLLDTADLGLRLICPPRMVVAGRPNVGKSTLVNRLLACERMIVGDRPGTTRDAVPQAAAVGGYPLVIVDTAGVTLEGAPLEMLASQRSRSAAQAGDVVLLVHDASAPYGPADAGLFGCLPRERLIGVLNKADLPARLGAEELERRLRRPVVVVSARTGEGFDRLERAVLDAAFPVKWRPGMAVVFTERQRRLLSAALESPERAREYVEECLHGAPRPSGDAP